MKAIKVNKNGFGMFSLFSEDSTKNRLTHESTLKGNFLKEIGIDFKVGDKTTIHEPIKGNRNLGHKLFYVRIYSIEDNYYLGEFIERNEI